MSTKLKDLNLDEIESEMAVEAGGIDLEPKQETQKEGLQERFRQFWMYRHLQSDW